MKGERGATLSLHHSQTQSIVTQAQILGEGAHQSENCMGVRVNKGIRVYGVKGIKLGVLVQRQGIGGISRQQVTVYFMGKKVIITGDHWGHNWGSWESTLGI